MSICLLPHLLFACVLNGMFAWWTLPSILCYLKSVLVFFLCYLKKKKKKKSALSRWKESPSISQVVFDDSDFTLAQGYPVSTQPTPPEHQGLKHRGDSTAPALKDLPLSKASGGRGVSLKTATKPWDTNK